MSDWQVVRLENYVELLTGHPFKSKVFSDNEGIKLLRGDNIIQGDFRWESVKRWPQVQLIDKHSRYFLKEGDVILAMDRPWIEAGLKFGQISESDLPCLLVQRTSCLRAKKGLNQNFLRYLISSYSFVEYVKLVQTGTAVPHISGKQINDFEFRLPPEQVQETIGSVLKSLDDKIQLNRQTNQTLEHMAQAIFKSWFVDFEPTRAKMTAKETGQNPEFAGMAAISGKSVTELDQLSPEKYQELKTTAALFPDSLVDSELGEIPEGWEVKSFGSVITNHDSKRVPLSKKQRETRKGQYPYYGAAAIFDYVDDYLFDGVHILIAEDGNTVVNKEGYAKLQYVWGRFWVNNHAHVLKGSDVISEENIYLFLKSVKVTSYVTGAAQPKINQRNMNSIPFLRASDSVHIEFGRLVKSIFASFRCTSENSSSLEKVRDLLLPKLLSGELNPKSIK